MYKFVREELQILEEWITFSISSKQRRFTDMYNNYNNILINHIYIYIYIYIYMYVCTVQGMADLNVLIRIPT